MGATGIHHAPREGIYVLELTGDQVERLRAHVVCLPR